jgi:hypothetical protein
MVEAKKVEKASGETPYLAIVNDIAEAARRLSVAIEDGESADSHGFTDPSGQEPYIKLDRNGFCLRTAYLIWKEHHDSLHSQTMAATHLEHERQKLASVLHARDANTSTQLQADGDGRVSMVMSRPLQVRVGPPEPAFPEQQVAAEATPKAESAASTEPAAVGEWMLEEQPFCVRILERLGERGFKEVCRVPKQDDGGHNAVLSLFFGARELRQASEQSLSYLRHAVNLARAGYLFPRDLGVPTSIAERLEAALQHAGGEGAVVSQ